MSATYTPKEWYAEQLVCAYLRCAAWTNDIEGDFYAKTVVKAEQDVALFIELAGDLLDGMDAEQAGHDLWLTRNHHGAGFWDRGLGVKGEKLTALAHKFGEVYLDEPTTEEAAQ